MEGVGNKISYNQFYRNFINGASNAAGIGVEVSSCFNTTICSNNNASASLISYYLDYAPGTYFGHNITYAGLYWSLLVGQPMGEQTHRGNLWYNGFGNGGTDPTWIETWYQSSAYLSKFKVHTTQPSDYHPMNVVPDSPPYEDVFFQYESGSVSPNPCMNGLVKNDKQLLTRNNEEADNFDIAIADGTYKSLSQKPVLAWDAERYLYKKLSENPNYVSKHKSFKEFLSRVDNKIVGKLHKIEKDIRDNTQYSEAQSIISTDRQNRSAELGKKLKELSIRKADRIELKQFEDERKNC